MATERRVGRGETAAQDSETEAGGSSLRIILWGEEREGMAWAGQGDVKADRLP